MKIHTAYACNQIRQHTLMTLQKNYCENIISTAFEKYNRVVRKNLRHFAKMQVGKKNLSPETTQAHNTISKCIEYGRVGKFGGEIG
jgi:hypothetical protein